MDEEFDYLEEAKQHAGIALRVSDIENARMHSQVAIALALIALVERLDKLIDYGDDIPALKVFRVCE